MDNKIMQSSILIFVIVFFVVLAFAYLYEKQKNKSDTDFSFDWTKYSLLALISGSASALLTSVCSKYQKPSELKFGMGGCGACSMKGKMEMNLP
jgi:uncharacterized protein (UPF0333 family)